MITKYSLTLFIIIIFLSGCTSGGDEENSNKPIKRAAAKSMQKYKYSVYLENSGSLNGYLEASGDGDFKSNVYDIIATLSNLPEKKSLSLYHINTKVDSVAENADATAIGNYFSTMTAASFKKRSSKIGGNQAKSDLYDIIKTVIIRAQPEDVSLLVSDCIFSPGKQGNAPDYLNQQESSIKALIGENLSRQGFSTLVLQFYSGFKGLYYYQDNSSRPGVFQDRPYYIICFGRELALRNLLKYAGRPDAKGFQNYLFLTTTKRYEVVPVIRSNTDYYEYDPESTLTITDAHRGGTDDRFRIKFNVDFSTLPVSENYLKTQANYELEQGYTIESVKEHDQGKSTHEIILATARPRSGEIHIALKKQLPEWITGSNLDEDRGLSIDALAGKTFGIRYLLEGIYNAYTGYNPDPYYFNFSISVKE